MSLQRPKARHQKLLNAETLPANNSDNLDTRVTTRRTTLEMPDLQMFGFVITFLTTVQGSVSSRASSLYSSGRKRVPQTLDGTLEAVEDFVASHYSSVRDWIEGKGTAGLQKVDKLVAKWYRSAGEACTSMVPESAAVAHDCWVKKFAEVSMLWREHGVVKGTLTVFGEMGDIIKGAAKRAANTPLVQSVVVTIEESPFYGQCKEQFDKKVQPMISEFGTSASKMSDFIEKLWLKLKIYTDVVIEKVDDVTKCVVAHPLYSKGVAMTGTSIRWAKSTSVFSGFVDNVYKPYMESHVGPIITAVVESKTYTSMISQLTPAKQE